MMDFIQSFKKKKRENAIRKCTISVCSLAIVVSTMCTLMLPALTVEAEADCGIGNAANQQQPSEIIILEQERVPDNMAASGEEPKPLKGTEPADMPEKSEPMKGTEPADMPEKNEPPKGAAPAEVPEKTGPPEGTEPADMPKKPEPLEETPPVAALEKTELDQKSEDEANGMKPTDDGQPQNGEIEVDAEQPAETDQADMLLSDLSKQTYYHGYMEKIDYNGSYEKEALRIKDGVEADGKDRIVYCYDNKKAFPPIENPPMYQGEEDRCLFTRIENYLEAQDDFILQYGPLAKEKVALALYAGYPCNAMGHKERFYGLTENDARVVTQQMVWDITNQSNGEYDIYQPPSGWSGTMVLYYNEIYNDVLKNFQPGNVFHQGWLEVTGDFTAVNRGAYWCTGEITTKGEKGTIYFTNVDPDLEILKFQDDTDVTKTGIAVGETFYIRSKNPLNETQRFTITLSYPQVKFFFYKWAEIGGRQVSDSTGKPIQNLVRVETTDTLLTQSFEVTLNGKTHATRSISVQKQWQGKPTDRIKVILYADDKPLQEVYLTAEKGWKHIFTGLPKMKDGHEIIYTVDEEEVPGYTKEIQGNMNSGYVIINRGKGYVLPETGGMGTAAFRAGGSAVIAVSLLMYVCLQISKRGGTKQKKI